MGQVTYFVVGREQAASGTLHIQGYFEFSHRVRLRSAKEALHMPLAHFEVRVGTAIQASNYCKKDGQFLEQGSISKPKQGSRSDLERWVFDGELYYLK